MPNTIFKKSNTGSTTYTAGDGLNLTGTEFSTDLKANSGLVHDSNELSMDLGASGITGTLALSDGGTGATTASAARNALGLNETLSNITDNGTGFPNENEGDISRRHADLVRMETLNRVSRNLELGRHVQMSRGEEQSGGRENSALLSDVCEAVIAALYQDGGLDVARAFIEKHWAPLIEENLLPPKDAKTTLQEWAQGEGHPLPLYTETGRDGPDHAPSFTVQVTVKGLEPASGKGGSKRLAEQAAAASLLKYAGLANE